MTNRKRRMWIIRYIKFIIKNSKCTHCGRWTPTTKLTYLMRHKICYRCDAKRDRAWANEQIALRMAKRKDQVEIIAEGVRLALLGLSIYGSTETKAMTNQIIHKLKDMDLNF